ncbi:MAG: isochorismatase family protein, partial [Polyangia bacterium]
MPSNHSALLVMDVQNAIVHRYGGKPEVMAPFARAVTAARQAGIPVIFVRVAFREGSDLPHLASARFRHALLRGGLGRHADKAQGSGMPGDFA